MSTGLLTVKEAARFLKRVGIGLEATYALARKHGVKVGRRFYLPRALVEGLVAGDLEAVRLVREGGEGGARGD